MTDRRQFLTAAGTGLAALLAGCSGRGGGGTTDESTTQTTVETTARTETQTPTETRSATSTSTESGDDYGDGYGNDYRSGDTATEADETDTAADTATATPTDTDTSTATNTPTDTDTPTATATDTTETVRAVADNILASAWEFVGDSGIGDGGRNPTITLEIGTRYVVENRGWSPHPFAFLAADGTTLLTQEDGGTFADDPGVDWRDDGEEFAFTVTPELAEAVSQYICTVHARMQGDVETV